MDDNITDNGKINDELVKLNELAVRFQSSLRFNKDDTQQLMSICLFATMLEFSISSATLMQQGMYSSVPVILRSFVEAYIDFKNVILHPEYKEQMIAQHLNEKKRMLVNARDERNEYLKHIHDISDYEEEIDKVYEELRNLKKKKIYPMSIAKRFKQAKATDLYNSIYAYLSSFSHNILSALEARHIEKSDGSINVFIFKADPNAKHFFDALSGILTDACISIQELIKNGDEGLLDEITRQNEAVKGLL